MANETRQEPIIVPLELSRKTTLTLFVWPVNPDNGHGPYLMNAGPKPIPFERLVIRYPGVNGQVEASSADGWRPHYSAEHATTADINRLNRAWRAVQGSLKHPPKGKQSRFSPEVRRKLVARADELKGQGLTWEEIFPHVKIPPTTLRRWKKAFDKQQTKSK